MDYYNLIEKAAKEHHLSKQELVFLLNSEECQQELANAADRVRQLFVGDEVHLRALIEFSSICKQNCLYCGLRRENRRAERYRLSVEEIVALAGKAKAAGYRTVVMQSGEDDYFTVDRMTEILKRIKAMDMAITLSIGEKSEEEYRAYKAAGADRYLLRIETTDKLLYEKLHPHMSFANRMRCLTDLKNLGYEVGTGCLIGLPGQTIESLADDLLFFKKIDADMVGIGPFIPNQDTPLKDSSGGKFAVALRFVSLLRLLAPDINIPATTAMETLESNARVIALKAGANVVMPNVTEGDYRRKYILYPGKICIDDTPDQCGKCLRSKIAGIGRSVSTGYGYRDKVIK